MTRPLPPAVLPSVSLIAGSWLGREASWCPPFAVILLLALGLTLRDSWGFRLACLAAGLLNGALARDLAAPPVGDRPVLASVRITGAWRLEPDGRRVNARSRWLRQGHRVWRWERDLRLVLPPSARQPEAAVIRVRGYLRRAVAPANAGRSAPGPWVLRTKSTVFVTRDTRSFSPVLEARHRLAGSMRSWLELRLSALVDRQRNGAAVLVRVLILGQSDRLPAEVARGLRAAGLAHLVALSGLHVGLLVGSVWWIGAWTSLGWRFVAAIGLALLYLLLAGLRPSLVRATFMMMAFIAAWQLRRPPLPVNVLAWVAAGMVGLDARLVDRLGFQLTVVATLGILLLAPGLERRWSHLPGPLRRPLSVSMAAHLAVLPWSLSVFHLATPLSPAWNLLAVPWASLSLTAALVWVITALIAPPFEPVLGWLLDLLAAPLEVFAATPPGVLGALPLTVVTWAAILLAVALTLALLKSGSRRWAGVVMAAVCLTLGPGQESPTPDLVILDVGQGEAILLRDRSQVVLIDGGGWRRADIAQRILLPALTRMGVRRLEAVIVSHPDTDHCGGLLALTSYMPVRRLYLSPGWSDSRCIESLLLRPGLRVGSLWSGEELRFARWQLRALHPPPGMRSGRNNRSLVLLATAGRSRVLLTGDLEAPGERQILSALDPDELARVEVLKVGHHGSDSSTTAEWLKRLQPRIALISCGVRNRYGHPHREVLARLTAQRVRILRTDQLGAIQLSFAPAGPIHIRFPGQPRAGDR